MPFDGSRYEDGSRHEVGSPITQMLVEGKQQLERGWCQRTMRQRGSVCMIGSLTINDFGVFTRAEELLIEAIRNMGYPHSSLTDFNDDPYRTQEQVLEVYDRAIEKSCR
jgi:hypothetical protein